MIGFPQIVLQTRVNLSIQKVGTSRTTGGAGGLSARQAFRPARRGQTGTRNAVNVVREGLSVDQDAGDAALAPTGAVRILSVCE
jgi:hypothetical protein